MCGRKRASFLLVMRFVKIWQKRLPSWPYYSGGAGRGDGVRYAGNGPHIEDGAVITDTGSTKRSVIRDTKDLVPEQCHFIPGHPLAGTEFSGPAAGFASLFEGRYWLILPNGADTEKVAALEELLARLGE